MQIFIYAFAAAYDVECSGLMPTFLDNNKILWMNDVIYHFHYIRTKHIFFRVTGWNVSCFVYPDWTYLSSCIRNVYITPFTRIEHIFLRVSGLNVSGTMFPEWTYLILCIRIERIRIRVSGLKVSGSTSLTFLFCVQRVGERGPCQIYAEICIRNEQQIYVADISVFKIVKLKWGY